MTKKLNKKQLIEILVNEYGYEQEDIKLLTNAKLEGMIKQEELDKEELKVQEIMSIVKDTKFKDDDMIMVMNGCSGALTHRSPSTGRVWDFLEFGQSQKLPYSELLTIRNNNPKVFKEGWMIILNPQIQDDFGLKDVYKNILTPDNVYKVFDLSNDELDVFIDNLPKGMKVTFIAKARELYNAKKIDSKSKIDFIENKFGISLEDNAPLSDIV